MTATISLQMIGPFIIFCAAQFTWRSPFYRPALYKRDTHTHVACVNCHVYMVCIAVPVYMDVCIQVCWPKMSQSFIYLFIRPKKFYLFIYFFTNISFIVVWLRDFISYKMLAYNVYYLVFLANSRKKKILSPVVSVLSP